MESTQATVKVFDLSNANGRANALRWGCTWLSGCFVGISINIGLGNRSAAALPIHIIVFVFHIVFWIILIRGVQTRNRRLIFGWLSFIALNLISSNVILVSLIIAGQLGGVVALMAISDFIGIFYWVWTYCFYLKIPLVMDDYRFASSQSDI